MLGAAIRPHTSGIARTTAREKIEIEFTVPRRGPDAKDSKYIALSNVLESLRENAEGRLVEPPFICNRSDK